MAVKPKGTRVQYNAGDTSWDEFHNDTSERWRTCQRDTSSEDSG